MNNKEKIIIGIHALVTGPILGFISTFFLIGPLFVTIFPVRDFEGQDGYFVLFTIFPICWIIISTILIKRNRNKHRTNGST